MKNPPTPLSPREQAALDRLEQWDEGWSEPKGRAAVVDYLTAGEFDRGQAERLIDQLLSKGYLYEPDEGIQLTEPP